MNGIDSVLESEGITNLIQFIRLSSDEIINVPYNYELASGRVVRCLLTNHCSRHVAVAGAVSMIEQGECLFLLNTVPVRGTGSP